MKEVFSQFLFTLPYPTRRELSTSRLFPVKESQTVEFIEYMQVMAHGQDGTISASISARKHPAYDGISPISF